jgi:hypothetical protein
MSQWTSKDMQGDQVTARFFCHFATALPAVYDERAKFPGIIQGDWGLEILPINRSTLLILPTRKYKTWSFIAVVESSLKKVGWQVVRCKLQSLFFSGSNKHRPMERFPCRSIQVGWLG